RTSAAPRCAHRRTRAANAAISIDGHDFNCVCAAEERYVAPELVVPDFTLLLAIHPELHPDHAGGCIAGRNDHEGTRSEVSDFADFCWHLVCARWGAVGRRTCIEGDDCRLSDEARGHEVVP